MYPKDLELSLSEELLQFTELLKFRLSSNISKTVVSVECPVELQYYRLLWMIAFIGCFFSLDVCFPNLESNSTRLQIYSCSFFYITNKSFDSFALEKQYSNYVLKKRLILFILIIHWF